MGLETDEQTTRDATIMKTRYLSAPVTDLDPSSVANAPWDRRTPAMSQKETKVRGVGFAFVLAAFLGPCITFELGAQVIVVPNSLAASDGNTFVTAPTGGPTSLREMQVFDASQFGALSGPSFLTGIAYRPDRIAGPSGPRSVTLRIYASTTSRSVAGLSTTFDQNIGADNTLVFSGTLDWTTGNLPGPGNTRQFDVLFPFTTPFLYDPAAGNLLLEMRLSGNGQAIRADTVTGNELTRKLVNTSSSNATIGSFGNPAQVVQFTFEPPPPVPTTFSDANWSSMGGIPGADRSVFAVVVDGSGNLYIGGSFNLAGEVVANSVAKWDGDRWTALDSGLNGPVRALAVSGGDLYVGGYFTTAGGQAATNIAQWNGSRWTALGSGMNGGVLALAVSGNDLYAGGSYTTAGGSAATNIAKWDGSSWSSVGSGLGVAGGWHDPSVHALVVSGGDVFAGGDFTTVGGIPAPGIAKWNGSSWSVLGSGVNGGVSVLAVLGADLYAGGHFTMAGGKVSAYLSKAIIRPPVLALERAASGANAIRFSGVPGSAYHLQRAPNPSGAWSSIATNIAPANGRIEVGDGSAPSGQGFYRVVGP